MVRWLKITNWHGIMLNGWVHKNQKCHNDGPLLCLDCCVLGDWRSHSFIAEWWLATFFSIFHLLHYVHNHTLDFFCDNLIVSLFSVAHLDCRANTHTHTDFYLGRVTPGHCPCLMCINTALCRSRTVTNLVVLYTVLFSAGCLIKLSAEQLKTLLPFSPHWPGHKRSELNSVRPLGLKSDGKMTFADSIRCRAMRRGHRWCFVSPDCDLTVSSNPHWTRPLCLPLFFPPSKHWRWHRLQPA